MTALFDYGTAYQAISREFLVDDDKISVESSGTVNGALSLVGSATVTFNSLHYVTVSSTGDDRGKYFYIEKGPRDHKELGMIITLFDNDFRFTTSVRNVRFPQPED